MKKIALAALAVAASVPVAAQPAQNSHPGDAAHLVQGQHGHAAAEEHDGHAVHRQRGRPETQAGPGQGSHQGGHRVMSGCCADGNNNGRMDCCEQGSACACCARRETGPAPARAKSLLPCIFRTFFRIGGRLPMSCSDGACGSVQGWFGDAALKLHPPHARHKEIAMRFGSLIVAAAALAAPAGFVAAQNGPAQVSIYEQRNYAGTPVVVSGSQADLGRAVQMRSIRVSGGAWELCEEANFAGRCARFSSGDADVRGLVRRVRSVRPTAPVGERG